MSAEAETITPTPLRPAWTIEHLRTLVDPATPPEVPATIRGADWKGLDPSQAAAAMAAVTSDKLLPLLGLLEPPEGSSKIEDILKLLETIATSQVETLATVRALASTVGVRVPPSPEPIQAPSATSPQSLEEPPPILPPGYDEDDLPTN